MRNEVVSAADAAALTRSGDTVASSGFVGIARPDELLTALSSRGSTLACFVGALIVLSVSHFPSGVVGRLRAHGSRA